MGGSSRIAMSWPDPPNELLGEISQCLHTETDARRFSAVCNSWRSSTPLVKKFCLTPLNLPVPFAAGKTAPPKHDGAYLRLTERTVYRVQPPNCREPNFWLVKIETTEDGKSRVLNPVNDHEIKFLSETQIPKVLNTLDFRVSEVCKSYSLHYVNPSKPNKKYAHKFGKKVAVSAGTNNHEYVITAIDDDYRLWYIRSGDEQWTNVRNDRFDSFFDIVNYKGQFYGIDKSGGVRLFDSMFEGDMITYSGRDASKRHLIELFDGDLVLVDEVTGEDKRACKCYDLGEGCYCNFPTTPARKTVEQIKISRMDRRGAKAFKAKMEFDGFIFLGDDCSFSVSAEEFIKGCKGTRVFYSDPYILFPTEEKKKPHFHYDYGDTCFECECSSDEDTGKVDNFDVKLMFRGLHCHNTGVFDFETGKVGSLLKFPEYAKIFWPPPSWLNRS